MTEPDASKPSQDLQDPTKCCLDLQPESLDLDLAQDLMHLVSQTYDSKKIYLLDLDLGIQELFLRGGILDIPPIELLIR